VNAMTTEEIALKKKTAPTEVASAEYHESRLPIVRGTTLYPLRFEPIFQYRLWGGRRLSDLISAPLPDGPVGEAWILSDREDHPSRVANGPLKGRTIAEIMEQSRVRLMGSLAPRFKRFPLLLKFLDAREMLSVQVHPGGGHPRLIPAGESSKTEAWVVIEAQKGSRIYAGLKPGTTEADLRVACAAGSIANELAGIDPKPGDAVFIPAGTVHTLGNDLVVFEVQQNSDVTFRLIRLGSHRSEDGTATAAPGRSRHLPVLILTEALAVW
jgi:mannose-6-phosphate isomerase